MTNNEDYQGYRSNFVSPFIALQMGDGAAEVDKLHLQAAQKQDAFLRFIRDPRYAELLNKTYELTQKLMVWKKKQAILIGSWQAEGKKSQGKRLSDFDEMCLREAEAGNISKSEDVIEEGTLVWSSLAPLLKQIDEEMTAVGVDTSKFEF